MANQIMRNKDGELYEVNDTMETARKLGSGFDIIEPFDNRTSAEMYDDEREDLTPVKKGS